MPTLAARLASDPVAQASPLRTSTLLGQAGGWGGDVLLMGSGTPSFAAGMASFAAGHAAYITGFRRHRDRGSDLRSRPATRAVAALWAGSAPVLALGAYRQEKVLGPAVLGYSAALATMVATAAHLDRSIPADARRLLLAGAATFLLSDTILGARKFLLTDPPERLESVVMATYTAGQLLLAEGAARA